MSELKARRIGQLMSETGRCDTEVYLKSEADKVIAEKDKTIADVVQIIKEQEHEIAENDENDEKIDELQKATDSAWSKVNAMYDELRHHKYKRCLAMAWWCSAELGMLISTWESKIKYYKRWHKRWLELAEKFKEAK